MSCVEPLTVEEVPEARATLARAFCDNPGMHALFPGTTERVRLPLLQSCMDGFTRSVLRYGVAEGVKDRGRVVAVSLSFRPGEFPPPSFATVIQARGPLRAGIPSAIRIARVDHEMRKRHPRYRHWYLWFLGVEPERQGQGLGSLLLDSLSRKAEADGVPCYLETDKPSSVRIYERHGYRVVAEDVLPPAELRLWFMKREAANASR